MVVTKSAVFPRTAEGTKYNDIVLIDKKCYSMFSLSTLSR